MTSVFLVTHWLRNGGMSLITKFKSLSNTQIKRILSLVLIIVLGEGSSAAVLPLPMVIVLLRFALFITKLALFCGRLESRSMRIRIRFIGLIGLTIRSIS